MSQTPIRRATAEDAAVIAHLARLTFRETFVDGFAIPYPPEDLAAFEAASFNVEHVARGLADPDQASWIAERDGLGLAYAHAGPCHLPHPEADMGQGELYRLYVARGAQGLGLGTRLLDTALDWMRRRFAGPQWLGVWSGNLKAQGLYARYGFAKVGEYRFPVGAWLDDEFIFQRP